MPHDDLTLLRQYAAAQSETAFAELVTRYLPLVYSAAVRRTGDEHLAEEIAQAVFILLARKAGMLGSATVLAGWLHRTTRYAAADALKQRRRRQQREHDAYMENSLHPAETEAAWKQLAPVLDAALDALNERDRAAVVLRFFENKTLPDVGAALGESEDGARMRVNRALEKLRVRLIKQGVTLGVTLIAGAVAAHAVKAAPAGLAVNIAATAAISGTTLTTTAMILLHKSLLTVALIAAVGVGTYEARQAQQARAELQTLQQLQAPLAAQIQQLQTERMAATNRLASMLAQLSSPPDNSELLRLRGQVGVLQHEADDASQKARLAGQKLAEMVSVQAKFTRHESAMINTAKEVELAMRLYARDNGGRWPTDFDQLTNGVVDVDRLVKMNVYEFDQVNLGAESLDVTHLQAEHPSMVVMREHFARQAPDGTWSRIYVFVDGSAVAATSSDGNFDAWEKANTYIPPPANP